MACELECICSTTGSREIGGILNSEVASQQMVGMESDASKVLNAPKRSQVGFKSTAPVRIMTLDRADQTG